MDDDRQDSEPAAGGAGGAMLDADDRAVAAIVQAKTTEFVV
jgi:hypothetical protein